MTMRVGQGFDIHAFADDSDAVLVLGGVTFPGERGLVGHSDRDVVAHACIDALLGASGRGDIGGRFPDTDAEWHGADSLAMMRTVVAELAGAGWQPVNIDCTVVCEAPRLAPRRRAMEEALAGAAGAPVSVKATRAEGLGSLGRGEGLACFAVALIETT